MKTYLLDILNKYNRLSENLDVKTILCNKAWLIFNDAGNKELYIFQEDGNLIASVNGNVHNGNWQYIPANKSIIISFKEQSYMLHPSFFDKTIFALQQDGTNKFAFMIDEQQGQSFQPKSLTELKSYFENIERKKIKAEQEKQEQIKQYHIEQERQQREQQRKRERIAEEEREKEERKKFILKQYKIYKVVKILGGILVCSPSLAWIDLFMGPSVSSIWGALFLYSMCPVYILILWYFYIKIMWKLEEYLIRKYNETQINNKKEQSRNKNRVEKRKQEREFRIKKEIEDNKRKIEERKKKEREWEEYRIQRDQRDFERIEKYRIEREKKERELKISKEENAKKEEEKNEQDLRGTELKIKEENS